MKVIKKNQVIIYVIALMLVTAGYLNFTSEDVSTLETSTNVQITNSQEIAGIGDATLVSSNDVVEEKNDNQQENSNNQQENTVAETSSISSNEQENKVVETSSISSEVGNENYFANSKLERSTMYSQMIETYEKLLSNNAIPEAQKAVATQEITKINEIQNSIMICENLISTKGFKNCVIFVNGNSISVIVEATELKQDEIAQIQNIISREMKAEITNIHITNK